jgi:uncharacterized membrane protein
VPAGLIGTLVQSTPAYGSAGTDEGASRWWSAAGLAAIFAGSAVIHLLKPDFYEPLIPEPLGSPRAWVWGSGIAELALAGLLLDKRRRKFAGLASAALLVGVFPANIKMALDGGAQDLDGLAGSSLLAYLRLPLQVPMVWWALNIAKSGSLQAGK